MYWYQGKEISLCYSEEGIWGTRYHLILCREWNLNTTQKSEFQERVYLRLCTSQYIAQCTSHAWSIGMITFSYVKNNLYLPEEKFILYVFWKSFIGNRRVHEYFLFNSGQFSQIYGHFSCFYYFVLFDISGFKMKWGYKIWTSKKTMTFANF